MRVAAHGGTATIYRPGRLSALDPRDNGITALRLILALTVVVSHSFAIGGFGLEPLVAETTHLSIGFVAVIGFFTLSGFLLARSRERTPIGAFVRNRMLRILPGYWLALLVGAGVGLILGAEPADAFGYVGAHLPLLIQGQHPLALNGALWTLQYEMFAYLTLVVVPARWLRPVGLAMAVVLGVVAPGNPGTWLLLAFALGVVAWLERDRIPMTPVSVGMAAAVVVPAMLLGAMTLTVVLVGYLVLALAFSPLKCSRDLSYGTCILAYPMQLILADAGLPSIGVLPWILVSLAVVLPLAWLSWTLVEQPFLRLRARPSALRSPTADRLREPAPVALLIERWFLRPDRVRVATRSSPVRLP